MVYEDIFDIFSKHFGDFTLILSPSLEEFNKTDFYLISFTTECYCSGTKWGFKRQTCCEDAAIHLK